MNWTLDQLKSSLNNHSEIKMWTILLDHIHRRERYFVNSSDAPENPSLAVDQDRESRSQDISVRIAVKKDDSSQQGEISKKLFKVLPLDEQIESAVSAAKGTSLQSWDFPDDLPKDIPQPKTSDPNISENLESVVNKLTKDIEVSATKKRNSIFNSAELFVSDHQQELHLSNGLTHRQASSRIYSEAAFSFDQMQGSEKKSDEYLSRRWSVGLQDISIESLFDEAAERASFTLDVIQPKSGKYAVLVDSEVLNALMNDYLLRLNSASRYQGLPFIEAGQPLVPNAKGDLISLTLDPSIELGAESCALSQQGVPQTPLDLVKDNEVVNHITDQQYAHYFEKEATTSRGNVRIPAGKHSYSELIQAAPVVIEIYQFSALFCDAASGTFSSEIRLGKLFDNETGTSALVKGGSLSGSLFENFTNVRFSDRQVKQADFSNMSPYTQGEGLGYYGPEFALLNEVSIVS